MTRLRRSLDGVLAFASPLLRCSVCIAMLLVVIGIGELQLPNTACLRIVGILFHAVKSHRRA